MKKVLLTAASLMLAVATLRAQAPARFNYQGIARSTTGAALPNQALGLRLSVLDGSSTGTTVYSETQTTTTNAFGLYNLAIGGGTPVTGTLAGVNWASGDKYIKVEIDATGGSNYVAAGTAQLLSVPYALHAASAAGGLTATGGSAGYLPRFTGASALANSAVFQNSGRIGIGTTTPNAYLHVISQDSTGIRAQFTGTTLVPNGIIRAEYTGAGNASALFGLALPTAQNTTTGTGVLGIGGGIGVRAAAQANTGVGYTFGTFSQAYSEDTAIALYGESDTYTSTTPLGYKYGVYGVAIGGTVNYGVFGTAFSGSTNYAGYFAGNVQVVGSLAKSAGTFKIDHPQDPGNKYLYHSFVESPDMMNVYNGNATTDAAGYVTVTLPGYFESLNKDFRYQLTVVGQTFAQAIVSQKVQGNQFQIRTNQPNVEVSWQVTGIRNDAYAQAHRVQPEVEKEAENKGKYLNPVELGKEASLQIGGTLPVQRKAGLQHVSETAR